MARTGDRGPRGAPAQLLFLPGASGDTRFWQPVAERLSTPAARVHAAYPGFGATPACASVQGLADLADVLAPALHAPTALVAQSLGGVVAALLALRHPQRVTHLVLAVTSGGIDTAGLGAEDWRPAFLATRPRVPAWLAGPAPDLTDRLPQIRVPTLLLWGDADPISPVAVGRRLAGLLPCARLHVLPGGGHDLAVTRAAEVARLIDAHLAA